ncbi:FAD-dependent monooxygenase [Streptomyces sp. AM 4-1-1]|uniref:FAD-dependent monooxygenase n=1 Tax=Streptomyces sp. AM 4-1-1 TaxID=3028710 RepID=UPI0023B9E4FB|nr:FAD-dependent monooxygenase [Streptomyces sp. AM 4-1-1]WEH35335.1 FAD-dependent monooxygenase [Streptomyces sp. AM 4-1-1]
MTSVLIVGAGPTGLILALDLARRDVGVRIIDRSAGFPRASRAKGPNPRSMEVLADLGVIDEVLAAGSAPLPMRKYRNRTPVTDTDPYEGSAPTPDAPYDRSWLIAQWRLEEILRDRLARYGVRVELDAELVAIADHGNSVTAELADGTTIGAGHLVGCDGARSSVRKLLGLSFEGKTSEDQLMVCGDVELTGPDRDHWHQWFDEDGAVLLCPIPGTGSGWWFQSVPEYAADGAPLPASLDGFRRLLTRYTGLPGTCLTDATLLSTDRGNERMVDRYRVGRVLLAGDAAHVHSIAGGLGMNTGIQDAFNLGWKLARVATGRSGAALLDTYEEERLPVAAWTLDLASDRLRATLDAIKEPGGGLDAAVSRETSGLDRGYRWSSLSPGGPGTPAGTSALRPGDRAPDAPCRDAATGEPTRLFEAFAGPHFTLLGFGAESARALRHAETEHGEAVRTYLIPSPPHPADRVPPHPRTLLDEAGHAHAAYGATGGHVPALVLVRPDNHVALLATATDSEAVRTYFDALAR